MIFHKKKILLPILLSLTLHSFLLVWSQWKTSFINNHKIPQTVIAMHFSYDQKHPSKDKKKLLPHTINDFSASKSYAPNSLPPNSEKETTQLHNYLMLVRNLIEKNKYYPASAKRLKIEGDVVLKFTILRNGEAKDIVFIEKSSFDPLNDAAIAAVLDVRIFPAIPQEITDESLTILQKISFKLQ